MKTVWIVDGAYLFNYGRNRPFDYLKLKAEMTRLIIEQIKNKHQLPLTAENAQFINTLVMNEYLAEFHGWRASA